MSSGPLERPPFLMHHLLTLLSQTSPSTTVAKAKKSSGSSYAFLIIIALFAVVYFFFLRPRQQRMRQQQRAGREIGIGDSVMSAGGIYGTVVGVSTDDVDVEVSPGVILTFTRRAISPRPGTQSQGGSAASPVEDSLGAAGETETDDDSGGRDSGHDAGHPEGADEVGDPGEGHTGDGH